MTDRTHALIVLLEDPTRVDDANELAQLLRQVRGVAEVRLGPIRTPESWAVTVRRDREWQKRLTDLVRHMDPGGSRS